MFLKLEKIEFGGLRGKELGEFVFDMYNEFQDLMTAFSGTNHDPLDPNNKVQCIIVASTCITSLCCRILLKSTAPSSLRSITWTGDLGSLYFKHLMNAATVNQLIG